MIGFIFGKIKTINSEFQVSSFSTQGALQYSGVSYEFKDEELELYVFGTAYFDYTKFANIDEYYSWLVSEAKGGNDLQVRGFCTVVVLRKEAISFYTDLDSYRSVYILQNSKGFLIGSSIPLIRKSIGSLSLNEEFLDFSLVYGFFPGNETVLSGVKRYLGGDLIVMENGEISTAKIAPKDITPIEEMSFNDARDKLIQELRSSIASYRSVAQKAGILLGGVDSALIAAIAKEQGFDVTTYTFYYEDESFNQDKVNELVEMWDLKHKWVKIDAEVIKQGLQSYAEVYSQPTNWPNYLIQSTHLAEHIKKDGIQVCFTGDGCDTLFQGYPGVYRSANFFDKSLFLAKTLGLLKVFADWAPIERKFGHIYRLFMRVYRNSKIKDSVQKIFLMYRINDEKTISRITGKPAVDIERSVSKAAEKATEKVRAQSISKLAYMGRSNMGPNRAKINGIIDETGIKLFSPYMHYKIKGFASGLPDSYFRPQNEGVSKEVKEIGKYILTEGIIKEGLLTPDIVFQPKVAAVDAPIDSWYENELKKFVSKKLLASNIIVNKKHALSLLEPKLAEKLYGKYISYDTITSHALSLWLTTLIYSEK